MNNSVAALFTSHEIAVQPINLYILNVHYSKKAYSGTKEREERAHAEHLEH